MEIKVPGQIDLVIGSRVCSRCGDECSSKTALAVHMARKHRSLRAARRKVISKGCPVCLRQFGGRSACLNHVHRTCNDTCLINLLLFYPDADEEKVEEANRLQTEVEAERRKLSEAPQYTGIIAKQMEGPLERFIVPCESKRQSRYALLDMYLSDPQAAVAADFDEIRISLYGGLNEDPLDHVPIALHPEM